MGVTLDSLPRQDPSFFLIPSLPGIGCGTPPRPTLEALPRKSMSVCVCTRWTLLLCRGRRTPSKSCYSVSPSTRSGLRLHCLAPELLGLPFVGCKGSSGSCSLPQGHGWGMLSSHCVGSVILGHWGLGEEGKFILHSCAWQAVISSHANPEDWAAKISWATVNGHVCAVSIQWTWGKTCWLKLPPKILKLTYHLSDMG